MISSRVLYTIDGPGWRQIPGFDRPGLAHGVQLMHGGTSLGFFTDDHPHEFSGHLERETQDGFDWHWVLPPWGEDPEEDRGILEFRLVTVKRYYEELVPAKVVWKAPQGLQTDEELWEYYRRTFEEGR